MTFDEQQLAVQDAKSASLLFLRAAQFTQSISTLRTKAVQPFCVFTFTQTRQNMLNVLAESTGLMLYLSNVSITRVRFLK